jgi:hypothetical protein
MACWKIHHLWCSHLLKRLFEGGFPLPCLITREYLSKIIMTLLPWLRPCPGPACGWTAWVWCSVRHALHQRASMGQCRKLRVTSNNMKANSDLPSDLQPGNHWKSRVCSLSPWRVVPRLCGSNASSTCPLESMGLEDVHFLEIWSW